AKYRRIATDRAGGDIGDHRDHLHRQVEGLEDGPLLVAAPAAQRAPQGRGGTGQPAEPAPHAPDPSHGAVGEPAAAGYMRQAPADQHCRAPEQQDQSDKQLDANGSMRCSSRVPTGMPSAPPMTNGNTTRVSRLLRTVLNDSSCPISDPN